MGKQDNQIHMVILDIDILACIGNKEELFILLDLKILQV